MDAHRARIETIKAELQDPRVVRPMAQLVRELMGVQRFCDMPKGTSDEWYKAIYALVDDGYLKMERGTDVSRMKVELPPESEPVVEKPKLTQGMLF